MSNFEPLAMNILDEREQAGCNGADDGLLVPFQFRYGQKSARIEILVEGPLPDQPGYEILRPHLAELLEALLEWRNSSQPIM